MKKVLFAGLLLSVVAHSADSPQAAMREYMDSLFAGDTARSMALTYIPPELLGEGVEEHALKQALRACYAHEIAQATADMKATGATLTQVNLRERGATLAYVQGILSHTDGSTEELPTLAVYAGASGWQVDILGELLTVCEAIDIGDPRDVVTRYLDAWARDDRDAAFALIKLPDPYYLTDLSPAEQLAQTRATFSDFFRDHGEREWRVINKPATLTEDQAAVDVISDYGGQKNTFILLKTSHGWRLRNW